MAQKIPQLVKTLPIVNFGGRLTRIINGDLNSGFAKFATSWGYDPFSKPMNLTWNYMPTDIKGSVITDAVLSAKIVSPGPPQEYVYAIGNSSKLYRIDPTQSGSTNTPLYDTPSVIAAVGSVSGTFNYGGDIDYYNSKLHISSDSNIVTTTLTGSNIASVSGTTSMQAAIYHPLVQFQGSLYYGNGNNIGKIDSTGIVVNGAVLSPALPTGVYISDLDITPDGTYMIITASYLYPNNISSPTSGSRGSAYAVDSYMFLWNGTDQGITAFQSLPSFPSTAMTTFMDKRYWFNQDAFGTALYEANQKLLTLPGTLSPMPDGATPNGTFITWISPEGIGQPATNPAQYTDTTTSLYYFGQLDAENGVGLWRMMRIAPGDGYSSYRAPLNMMVNNYSQNLNLVAGYGKHYISTWEYNRTSVLNAYHLYRFVLQKTEGATPALGVYETQNQLFSKRIGISQIRVYTEPVVSGNGFQLDVIGGDGLPVTNGTFTYAYGDPTSQNERINFNPNMQTLYSMGIRLTNTGTTNMTIKKVEIDYSEEGK